MACSRDIAAGRQCAEERKGSVEEGRDEQQTDDRADVADRRADPGESAALLGRHEIGQHGVVERLRRLIRVVGDHERDEHPAKASRWSDAIPPADAVPPIVSAPLIGRVSWPRSPMAAQAMHETIVNPTTHGLRRRRASDTAPSTGTDNTTRMDEMPFPTAYTVFDACRSAISQTEK